METDGVVTQAHVESSIRQLSGTTTAPEHVFVVDAFKVPRVRYDAIHKRLVEDTSCLTLQPEADVSLCTYTCAYCHLSFVISVMKQM